MKNKIILVTGAASGIGYETARQFIDQGATVIGVDMNADNLEIAAKKLGDAFVSKVCDITNTEQIKALRDFVGETYARLDVLINNAGAAKFISMDDMTEADYYFHFDLLVKGPMFMTQYLAPLLKKSDEPSIVIIASSAARVEVNNHHLYSTAKAAIEKFTYHMVRDYPGIRCNTILPGFIETPIFKSTGLDDLQIKDTFEMIGGLVPCGRMGQPDDIANCILFLSSDQATYINGAAILIDGGWLRSADWGF